MKTFETVFRTENYVKQSAGWPQSGKHILANFDADSIIVYQAYRPAIADYAVRHQEFGGEFSYSRMSWIKPNFLWMMYRSGWATKEGQERILAIRLSRRFFDEILAKAVASSFESSRFTEHAAWKSAVDTSDVRLQWDPDHDPFGRSVERRAIQLGLRGGMLERLGKTQSSEMLSIEDITPFVIDQRNHLNQDIGDLVAPSESIYQPSNSAASIAVGIDLKL